MYILEAILCFITFCNLCLFILPGTHWLCNIIYFMLQKGELAEVASHQPPLLEMFKEEVVEKLTSPRVLTSHLLPSSVPQQIFAKQSKVILLYRNPKDTAVSLYYHLQKIPGSDYKVSWNCHVEHFMKGKGMCEICHRCLSWMNSRLL